MPKLKEDVVFSNFLGRNGGDPPFKLFEGQCREAVNIEFDRTGIGRKRAGSAAITSTGLSDDGGVNFLSTFDRTNEIAEMEMFMFGDSSTAFQRFNDNAWSACTMVDNIDFVNGIESAQSSGASFNGKMFLAYPSSGDVNRLHVWDPADSKVRRCGLGKPAAATVANTGSGSYAATERHYKIAWLVKSGSDILRRSELSAKVTFTPSGSGTAARVTKPASISEDETHWEVYGSADDAVYYLLSEIAVGTTTYDDSTAPASYTGDGPPSVGTNLPPPSAKYLVADEARVVMAGTFATAAGDSWDPKSNRVWWTALLGTNNIGDDERVPDITGITASYLDFDEDITALAGPIFGSIYVFSRNKCWRMVSTGNAEAPYIRIPMGNFGCMHNRAWCIGEDERGNPSLYFFSDDGPRRIGVDGVQRLGDDIRDQLDVFSPADSLICRALMEYYPKKQQVSMWYATTSTLPQELAVFHVRLGEPDGKGAVRGGWALWNNSTGSGNLEFNSGFASCMYPDTPQAAAQTKGFMKPYHGFNGAGSIVAELDTGTTDAGSSYQAYIDTPEIAPWGFGQSGAIVEDPYIYAEAQSGVTLTLTVDRDFGAETSTSTAVLTADNSETRRRVKFEGTSGADMEVIKLRVGDSANANNTWNLDMLVVPLSKTGRDGNPDD